MKHDFGGIVVEPRERTEATHVVVWSVRRWAWLVGPCAKGTLEPSQGRKAAALSGKSLVPQVVWPVTPSGARFHGGRARARARGEPVVG